jgi:hypothetical protein
MRWWPDQLKKEYRTFFCSSIHFVLQQDLISGLLDAGAGCHREAGGARTGAGSHQSELICHGLTTIAEVGVRYPCSLCRRLARANANRFPTGKSTQNIRAYVAASRSVALDSSNWVSRDKASASDSDD